MEIRWLGEVCSALPYWNLQRNPYSVWSKLSGVALKPPKGKSRHRFLRGLLLLWSRSLILPSLHPFHTSLVGAHRLSARIHAGPPVGPLFDDFHFAIRPHVQDRCVVQYVFRCSPFELLHELLVTHIRVLRVRQGDWSDDRRNEKSKR